MPKLPHKNKLKLDSFHWVLFGAGLFGLLSVLFIFFTAKPQELKLIKWSAVPSYYQGIAGFVKIQYPDLSKTSTIKLYGLKSTPLNAESFIHAFQAVAKIKAVNESASSQTYQSLKIQSKNSSLENLNIFITQHKVKSGQHIDFQKFYDPKELKKQIEKNQLNSKNPLLITAYKKSSTDIFIKFIQLQSPQ